MLYGGWGKAISLLVWGMCIKKMISQEKKAISRLEFDIIIPLIRIDGM